MVIARAARRPRRRRTDSDQLSSRLSCHGPFWSANRPHWVDQRRLGGLTVTGLLQSLQEGRVLSAELWLAWALVVASTWLHGRYPWRRKGD